MSLVVKEGYVALIGLITKTIATNVGKETVVINIEDGVEFAIPEQSSQEAVASGWAKYPPVVESKSEDDKPAKATRLTKANGSPVKEEK